MLKRCSSCAVEKPHSDFHKQGDRLRSACSSCARSKCKERYSKSKGEHRANGLKRRYGISVEQYSSILIEQGGGCAICHASTNVLGRALYVDHDHKTGKVRGLLCHKCNTGLGSFRDSPALTRSATLYLEK